MQAGFSLTAAHNPYAPDNSNLNLMYENNPTLERRSAPGFLQKLRRMNIKILQAYVQLLAKLLESVSIVVKEPAYLFDFGIITYWLSKLI